MAGDGKEDRRDVCKEGGTFGENELGGRGWKGKWKGCLKGGALEGDGRASVEGGLEGEEFVEGVWYGGVNLEWTVEGMDFLLVTVTV